MLISRPLSLSLSVLCSVQCAGRVSLKALCPSFPDLRVSGGGMGLWGDPLSSPLVWWWSAQAPWALCPYVSPQEEHLLGIPLRSGCCHCCFSVPKAHEYLACVHEPRKCLQTNHQIKPVRYSADTVGVQFKGLQVLGLSRLETKERSQSWQRYQSFNRWNVLYIWSKRVLERYPLWIADDRQNTESAIFFTLGGWGVYQVQGELTTDWLIHYIGYQGKPVDGNIPLLAPEAKYFHTLLIYQQIAILKMPENAEGINKKGW